MTSRKPWIAALVGTMMLPSLANAQFPTPSAGAAPGFGGAAAPAPAAVAAAGVTPTTPRTLWGFLGLNPTSMQNAHTKLQLCRDKFCQSQFGQMLGGFSAGPLAGVTGGFIPSVCPPSPSPATLSALESQSGPMGGRKLWPARSSKARPTPRCAWLPSNTSGPLTAIAGRKLVSR